MTTHIRLDTSDFTVERGPDDRITVYVDGAEKSVVLDLDPGVAFDLMVSLANPEDPS